MAVAGILLRRLLLADAERAVPGLAGLARLAGTPSGRAPTAEAKIERNRSADRMACSRSSPSAPTLRALTRQQRAALTREPVDALPLDWGLLTSLPSAVNIKRGISLYRGYRDWWKEFEVRQPGIALLLRAAAVMLGFLLAALLIDSLNVGILVGAVIGVTIAASATGYRRRTRRDRVD